MGIPDGANVFATDEACLAATYRNIYITAWWGETTVARLRRIGEVQTEIARKWPKGFCALALIRSVNTNLPAEVRAEAEKLSREPAPGLQAIAQVIYGSGFGAAAIRSIATGMQIVSRQPRPTKIFDTLENAAVWLVPRLNALPEPSSKITETEVVRVVRALVAHAAPDAGAAPW